MSKASNFGQQIQRVMKSIFWSFFFLLTVSMTLKAQESLYFPTTSSWETIDPISLGWCQDSLNSLDTFLVNSGTKSFILLHDGKIVLEKYFNGHTSTTPWYWASAGKSLSAMVTGIAQEQGFFDINDPVSNHLGAGWTAAQQDTEAMITIKNLLTMTSGLNEDPLVVDTIVSPELCADPSCLQYLDDPGTLWSYHTGAYYKLADVVEATTGLTYQQATNQMVMNKIGGTGFWYDNELYWSTARTMARFGLLTLAEGQWNGVSVLGDAGYFQDMTTSSQGLNQSYGYLWWLNGQPSFMLPGLQLVLYQPLMPDAPADLYAALGKNDQKIHVVPSKNWVIVRQGEAYETGTSVPIVFDNELWKHLNTMTCPVATSDKLLIEDWKVAFNTEVGQWQINWPSDADWTLDLFDTQGGKVRSIDGQGVARLSSLPSGHFIAIGLQEGKTFKAMLTLVN
jgi:Beta-lactamase